jgi:hypothetical protein
MHVLYEKNVLCLPEQIVLRYCCAVLVKMNLGPTGNLYAIYVSDLTFLKPVPGILDGCRILATGAGSIPGASGCHECKTCYTSAWLA